MFDPSGPQDHTSRKTSDFLSLVSCTDVWGKRPLSQCPFNVQLDPHKTGKLAMHAGNGKVSIQNTTPVEIHLEFSVNMNNQSERFLLLFRRAVN